MLRAHLGRPSRVQASLRSSCRHVSSLVPRNNFSFPLEANQHHLRWLLQKYLMKQDVILMGPPTPLRRRLVMALAEAKGWEVEYVAISKDTTESDLKQRREIIGDTAVYVDQPPVRAAINGRILVLDGLESAERNVLPTLNNLLENREMSLDDGRFLMPKPPGWSANEHDSKLVFVHENFRVIGLSVPVPSYSGRTLDPPLRSRFQCRFIDEYPSDVVLSMTDTSNVQRSTLLPLLQFYESLRTLRDTSIEEDSSLANLPIYSQEAFTQGLAFAKSFPALTPFEILSRFVPSATWMKDILPERLQYSMEQIVSPLDPNIKTRNKFNGSEENSTYSLKEISPPDAVTFTSQHGDTRLPAIFGNKKCGKFNSIDEIHLLPRQRKALSALALDHTMGHHICLLGPKGCGKSVVAREFSKAFGYAVPRMFPLYKELTARDLLQRRVTDTEGNTTWADSPLVRAAREGNVCILDGIHALDIHALGSLRRLLQDGVVDLPSGERLALSHNDASNPSEGIIPIKQSFRVIALGLPASKHTGGGSNASIADSRSRYITTDLGWTYHAMAEGSSSEIVDLLKLKMKQQKCNSDKDEEQIRRGISRLGSVLSELSAAAGDSHSELKPSFRHAVNISNSLSYFGEDSPRAHLELRQSLENTFLIRYMPGPVTDKFNSVMLKCGLDKKSIAAELTREPVEIDVTNSTLSIGEVSAAISTPKDIEKVPRPVFFENATHGLVLQSLLRTHTSHDHNSILLIGNQGVGKNKLVDKLLSLLQREREYVQLHRDTTVQALTVLPSLQDGKIVYEDSPLLKAAKNGTVLVIDEADKAPVEVISILKTLVEDQELVLYDGRRLLSASRVYSEGFELPHEMLTSLGVERQAEQVPCPPEVIPIHPSFRLIVLANRPGFPFHGNNLFRECGDIFSVHVVENLDLESEISLLQAYGPDVPVDTIRKLALSFQDLRAAYENQELSYPYSAREAVSVVKHLQSFPEDGIQTAVEDILGFEGFNPRNRKQIASIFQSRGLPIPLQPPLLGHFGSFHHSADILNSSIFLASSTPLPAPTVHSVCLADEGSSSHTVECPVDTSKLKAREWSSNFHEEKSFQIDPKRLFSFSEEIGRFYVGDPRTMKNRNAIVGMVADDAVPNALHVLTRYPLELHSFYPSGNDWNNGTCVRRELIDEDIHWRMGDPQAVLGSLPGGGASIYLPMLDLALVAKATPADSSSNKVDIHPVQYVHLSLDGDSKPAHKGSFKAFKDGLSSLFRESYSKVAQEDTAGVIDRKQSLKAVFKMGHSHINVVDFSRSQQYSHALYLPASFGGLRKMHRVQECNDTKLGEGSSPWTSWLVVGGTNGNKMNTGLLSFDICSSKVLFTHLDLDIPQFSAAVSNAQNSSWVAESACDVLSSHNNAGQAEGEMRPTHHVYIDGYAEAHGGRLDLDLSFLNSSAPNKRIVGRLQLWPKAEAIGKQQSRAVPPAAGNIIPAQGPKDKFLVNASSAEPGNRKRQRQSSTRSTLEVSDLELNNFRELELHSSRKGIAPESDQNDSPHAPDVRSLVVLSTRHESNAATERSVVAVLDDRACVRLFEISQDSLTQSLRSWKSMMGVGVHGNKFDEKQFSINPEKDGNLLNSNRSSEGTSDPRFGVDKPKHGKEDEKNEPHVGGNTWAGGTGGSDTAGLGGRGGPYRLDKGHKVHQVSEEDKKISEEAKARAAAMAKEAFEKRMKDIKMGKQEFENYEYIRNKVQQQSNQLRQILEELNVRSQERVWLRNQTQGELDDSKLVDGLTGDRMVFKRRGVPEGCMESTDDGGGPVVKKRLQFIMDVSGSMYRFNSRDKRLERMLEAALLVMTAMPNPYTAKETNATNVADNLEYALTGHSGDSDNISFVPFGRYDKVSNEKKRLQILQEMIAHTQFCMSGDNTLEAASRAIRTLKSDNKDGSDGNETQYQRYAFVLSDANFERYGITPGDIRRVMHQDPDVEVHFIFIATLGDEAERFKESLPPGRVHMCYESTDLPAIFKKILTAYGGALHI